MSKEVDSENHPWIDRIFSDTLIITGILVILPLANIVSLVFIDGFGLNQLIVGASQGILVGMATVIALLSYRYSVRSNIQDTLQGFHSIEVGDYKAVVTLQGVRWRPPIRIGSYFHQGELSPQTRRSKIGLELRPRTSIQIHVYDISNGQRIATEGAKVLEDMGIPLSELSDSGSSILEENLRAPLNLEVFNGGKTENGIFITFLSADGNEIKKAIQSILIFMSEERPNENVQKVGEDD